METGASVSGSNSCPRSSRLRLGFFSSLALALAVIVIVSGFYYKSVPISVEKETRLLAVDTLNFKRPRFNTGIIVPRRTDRGDNMASTDSRLNWSSLVGTNAEEAKNKIKEQHPHLHVVVVAKDAMMTMDYNVGRVRIFKDDNQNVAWIPKLG